MDVFKDLQMRPHAQQFIFFQNCVLEKINKTNIQAENSPRHQLPSKCILSHLRYGLPNGL